MGTYASASDVVSRIPYRTIGASTSPSTTTVDGWVTEAEARLHATMKGAQLSTPITDSDGIEVAKAMVVDYAEGRVRMAFAAAGGDGTNEDGRVLVERFESTLEGIAKDRAGMGAILGGGAPASGARTMRSHVLDHPDGQTVSAGDFAPVTTKRAGSDQF